MKIKKEGKGKSVRYSNKCWIWMIVLIVLIIFIAAIYFLSYKKPAQPAYVCGNGICETNKGETSINCPTDCATCGNGICEAEAGESYKNCSQDCCASEGEIIMPPRGEHCCQGLIAIPNLMPTENGCIGPFTPRVCSYCGNGVCGLGENYCNCPEDCKEKPQIERGVYGYITLLTGDCSVPLGPTCNEDYIDTKVKLYNLVLSNEMKGNYYIGKSIGWFDSKTENKIKEADCYGCEALCLYNGTDSEGWYDSCQDITNVSASLIKWEQCSQGTQRPYCKIIKNEPIAIVESQNGFYEFNLTNGVYSIFVEDPTIKSDINEYCNVFSNAGACVITINDSKVKFNITIDHATH